MLVGMHPRRHSRGGLVLLAILAAWGWSCGSTSIWDPLDLYYYTRYSGVWLEDESAEEVPTLLGKAEDARGFNRLAERLSSQGYRITDLEALVTGRHREYAGLWRPGDDLRPCLLDLSRERFESHRRELRDTGFEISDLEIYGDANELRYAAIWRKKPPGSSEVGLDLEWSGADEADEEDLCPRGFQPVDVEAYLDDGLKLAIVCQRDAAHHRLLFDRGREKFEERALQMGSEGWRLLDFESIRLDDGRELYLGLWIQASGTDFIVQGAWQGLVADQNLLANGVDPRYSKPGGTIAVWFAPNRLIDLDILGRRTLRGIPSHGFLHEETITVPPTG